MRVLVIGANGMLGHVAARTLSVRHEVTATLRRPPTAETREALAGCRIVSGIDVSREASWRRHAASADVVLNCAGIVKQKSAEAAEVINVNAVFPHKLAICGREAGVRVIHISTDCVFSGRRGQYHESDEPDPVDLYGRSKLLGELDESAGLTIRTSMIGLELENRTGLIEWFLAQHGTVRGYRMAIWSGFTTAEFARIISRVVEQEAKLRGVWHVSSAPISKYDLLCMLNQRLGGETRIVPDDAVVIDRSLNSDRFVQATGFKPPSHEVMLDELAAAIRNREENRIA